MCIRDSIVYSANLDQCARCGGSPMLLTSSVGFGVSLGTQTLPEPHASKYVTAPDGCERRSELVPRLPVDPAIVRSGVADSGDVVGGFGPVLDVASTSPCHS